MGKKVNAKWTYTRRKDSAFQFTLRSSRSVFGVQKIHLFIEPAPLVESPMKTVERIVRLLNADDVRHKKVAHGKS